MGSSVHKFWTCWGCLKLQQGEKKEESAFCLFFFSVCPQIYLYPWAFPLESKIAKTIRVFCLSEMWTCSMLLLDPQTLHVIVSNVCLLCAFFLPKCWANMQDIQWSSPSVTFSSTPVEVFSAPIAFPAVTAAVPPKAVCRWVLESSKLSLLASYHLQAAASGVFYSLSSYLHICKSILQPHCWI